MEFCLKLSGCGFHLPAPFGVGMVNLVLCLGLALTLLPVSAQSAGEGDGLAAGGHVAAAVAGGGGGRLLRVSDKSREIGNRLERSGYYRRLSRAYRGYPHLRSKKSKAGVASSGVRLGYNAAARVQLRSSLVSIARAEKVDPELLDAVIVVESGYNAEAVSPKGAMGLMQLMPATAERFGVAEPFDSSANMRGGARYLRWLMKRFEGELKLVLAAYNAGEGAVAAHGNRIPPFPETQQYVERVLRVYRGGDS